MSQQVLIGVDLGGTNVKTAIVSKDKKVVAKDSRPTEAEQGPEVVMDVMEQSVRELMRDNGIDNQQIMAVGFGAPGPLNWQKGLVYDLPNLPGWRDVPLAQLMEQRLDLPCYVDNDANVACYGEYWMGAGQGTQCMVVLTLGTGVGGGIVVFGQLLRGIDGTAAELGHLKVQRDGRLCGCGSHGCLEAYASVTGMVRTAVEGIKAGKSTSLTDLCGGDLDNLTGEMISYAIGQGDEFAKWVMQETGRWIGTGVGSLINIFNPEKVVLCGGMIAAGDILFDAVRQAAADTSFEVPYNRAQIVPAGLGGDSGVIGAAGCGLARHDAATAR